MILKQWSCHGPVQTWGRRSLTSNICTRYGLYNHGSILQFFSSRTSVHRVRAWRTSSGGNMRSTDTQHISSPDIQPAVSRAPPADPHTLTCSCISYAVLKLMQCNPTAVRSVWQSLIYVVLLEAVFPGDVELYRVILRGVPNNLSIQFIWIRVDWAEPYNSRDRGFTHSCGIILPQYHLGAPSWVGRWVYARINLEHTDPIP